MKEIWKDIKGYEGYYQVSSEGRVKSLARKIRCNRSLKERILKPGLGGFGYPQVILCVDNQKYNIFIHRLVAEAFIPNLENKLEVNHIDGNKENNRVDNLEWCTRKENMTHADTVLGLNNRGENSGNSKVTESEVIQIKESSLLQRELASIFGLSQQHISDIKNGRRWGHL